jgi:hypothetical protein
MESDEILELKNQHSCGFGDGTESVFLKDSQKYS